MPGYHHRLIKFLGDIVERTPIIKLTVLLVGLWLLSSVALWWVEHDVAGTPVTDIGAALYWSVAAFSTAGIANSPVTNPGRLIGGAWIVVGSVIYFGAIIAAVTGYFMRPVQRPVRNLIDTIENNLEHIEDLSIEELELLRETADGLIEHMERIKTRSIRVGESRQGNQRNDDEPHQT